MKNIWVYIWDPLVDYLEKNFFCQETGDAEVDVKLQKKKKCKVINENDELNHLSKGKPIKSRTYSRISFQ